MENEPKRLYTKEEIKKIAPGYRGKPERFDPAKVGKKAEAPQKKGGPTSKEVAPPKSTDKATTPTPPKNSPMWADSIFGIDVAVRELQVDQSISPNFSKLADRTEEVYASIGGDDKNLNKQLTKEMVMYYHTSLLWARLLDTKSKRGNANLNFEEQEYLKAMLAHDYNVPQRIYPFLKGIGEVKDATGKIVNLENHRLPRHVVQGMGGYHSAGITEQNHNLYEEVPSLGICGDVLMAVASEAANPTPNFRVIPRGTRATRSLTGYFGAIGARKEEVRIDLESIGITATTFAEQIAGTRLNIRLVQKVSDYFAGCPTFRMEKVKRDALTGAGDEVQLIKLKPTDENTNALARWTDIIVRPTAARLN